MPTCCVQREIMFIRPTPALAVLDRPVNCGSSLFLVALVVALVVLLSVWFVNQVSRPTLCLWVADCFGLVSVASVQRTSHKPRATSHNSFSKNRQWDPIQSYSKKRPNQQKHHCCDLPNKRFNRLMSEMDMSYKMDNELKLSSELTT